MIVSVSRRCDVPAFQAEWFMGALRAGAVDVANPFRPGPPRRLSLRRGDVDAFVFWSRDVRPLLRHVPEIESGGFPSVFLLTATGYPRALEPAVPSLAEAAAFFRGLASLVGRRRIAWRYDPVVFTPATGPGYHARRFAELAGLLAPYASRVIVSFFDPYPKALRRLRRAGIDAARAAGTPEQQAGLLERLAASAAAEGLEIQSCAEAASLAAVPAGKCVDEAWLNERFGLNLSYRKDPGQRRLCRCTRSVDIGAYGDCAHGCLYCYARR
jgi:hypothetical protein